MKSVCLIVQGPYDFDPRVRRKAEALVEAGYSVDVLALRSSNGKKTYSLKGVNVYTVSLGKKRGSQWRYFFEYGAFFVWALVRVSLLMRRRRYAVIDVNTLPDFLIFAPVLARWMGAKLLLDLHEITPEFYMSKYRIRENSWIVRALKFQEKISIDFADHVLTIHEPIQELLVGRGLPPSKSTVIMNAVDDARFAGTVNPSASLDNRGGEKFVMMYHGTLTQMYGLDIAIEAFALAHKEMPGAELWILGSGTEEKALAGLAQHHGLTSKVRLFGKVPPADIPGWLDKCDVGILPFRKDVFLEFVFPNKLPEFIISGKAVIMSRLKAIQHYFSDEALAYCEPNNPADLARQMACLYGNPKLRARLVQQASKEYEPISWSVMKERYVKAVLDLAGAPATTSTPPAPREVAACMPD